MQKIEGTGKLDEAIAMYTTLIEAFTQALEFVYPADKRNKEILERIEDLIVEHNILAYARGKINEKNITV